MYTIIICAIIGFIIGAIMALIDEFDFFFILTGIAGAFIGAIIGLVVGFCIPVKYKTDVWSENLESLRDNNNVNGNFFLGSGQINGSMKYVYYCKEDSNTYKMWQAEYYQASIRYTDKVPKINITYKHVDKDYYWNKFSLRDGQENWSCIFDVPKGSIKNNFELDAQ